MITHVLCLNMFDCCQCSTLCPLRIGDESHPSAAVEDILVAPDKLRDLDLDAFAEELERQVRLQASIYMTPSFSSLIKGVKHHFVDVHNIMSFDCL